MMEKHSTLQIYVSPEKRMEDILLGLRGAQVFAQLDNSSQTTRCTILSVEITDEIQLTSYVRTSRYGGGTGWGERSENSFYRKDEVKRTYKVVTTIAPYYGSCEYKKFTEEEEHPERCYNPEDTRSIYLGIHKIDCTLSATLTGIEKNIGPTRWFEDTKVDENPPEGVFCLYWAKKQDTILFDTRVANNTKLR